MPVDMSKREEIKFKSLDRFKPLLYADLFIPSWVNGYSIGVEFIYNWFLSKFPRNFFRTIHVASKAPYDDFRKFEVGDLTKREKPACAFSTSIQYDFNDNFLDLNYYGVDTYIKRSKWQRSFFKDPKRGFYIGYDMECMLLNFNIRTRLDTRAQQLDTYNRMRKVFRIGCTETVDLDMDIHLPYELMLQLAEAVGVPVDHDEKVIEQILDPYGFTKYLNRHSTMPIMYKMRYINGKHEFFVRMRNLPVHLNLTNALDADDGEMEGQLATNFNIDMQIVMRLPVPNAFLFYDEGKYENTVHTEPVDGIKVYSMRVFDIPEVNYKGWPIYGSVNYTSEKEGEVVKRINIRDAFKAPVTVKVGSDLDTLIEKSIKEYISPDSFIEVALYTNDMIDNEGGRIPIKMDWKTREIVLPDKITNSYFYIAIYYDLGYINSKVADIIHADEGRVRPSNKRIVNPEETKNSYNTEPYIEEEQFKGYTPKLVYKKHIPSDMTIKE